MLDGSKSYDPNLGDSIVNYRWAQTSGIPVILVGGGSNSPNPTFVAPRLPTAGSTTTTTNMLTFSLTVTDNLGLTSTIPSITNVIVAYNPQIHATLNPTPQPTIIQNPSTSQQQLLPQNALPQLQRQLQLQPPLGNRVIVPSHIQNQSIPNIGNQYSNNINPYSFRPYYYQNKSLAANLSPQLRHNTLPFLNLSQHPTTKTSVGQNSSLPKIQAASK